jgi:hypothetical protein
MSEPGQIIENMCDEPLLPWCSQHSQHRCQLFYACFQQVSHHHTATHQCYHEGHLVGDKASPVLLLYPSGLDHNGLSVHLGGYGGVCRDRVPSHAHGHVPGLALIDHLCDQEKVKYLLRYPFDSSSPDLQSLYDGPLRMHLFLDCGLS